MDLRVDQAGVGGRVREADIGLWVAGCRSWGLGLALRWAVLFLWSLNLHVDDARRSLPLGCDLGKDAVCAAPLWIEKALHYRSWKT